MAAMARMINIRAAPIPIPAFAPLLSSTLASAIPLSIPDRDVTPVSKAPDAVVIGDFVVVVIDAEATETSEDADILEDSETCEDDNEDSAVMVSVVRM